MNTISTNEINMLESTTQDNDIHERFVRAGVEYYARVGELQEQLRAANARIHELERRLDMATRLQRICDGDDETQARPIEWRQSLPTSSEADAHSRAYPLPRTNLRGAWCVRGPNVEEQIVQVWTDTHFGVFKNRAFTTREMVGAEWCPLDADGNPVPWPEVG
jgi:hypothetical protein